MAVTVDREPVVDGSRGVAALAAALPARRLKGLALPLALLVAWEGLCRLAVLPPEIMPAPSAVLDDLVSLVRRGELDDHVLITAWRVLLGFATGTLAATVLGALTGFSREARAYLDPTLQALKAVPSLAWVPLFILWFGIFETSKLALIALGAFFPVYLALMTAIQDTDRKLVEVGRINGLSAWQMVRHVLVPSTLPAYVVGLRGGLALGWMFVIAAELMGSIEGLGFLMVDGQMTGRPAVIVASLLLFALCGKLTDAVLARIARPWLAWQDGFAGMQAGGGRA